MKFGFVLSTLFPTDMPAQQKIQETVEQVRVAREAGFDCVTVSHHYLSTPYRMLQLVPLIARLIPELGQMSIASNIFLLTIHNPVYVAEVSATLDALAAGRFIFGVGLGYRDVEFEAFGIPMKTRAERFEEMLEVVHRLWTEDEVTYRGRHVAVDRATVSIKPVQVPHPPVWIAASGDRAVARAARLGDAWLINPHTTLETLRKQVAMYREGLRGAGRPLPAERPIFRECFLARDYETAAAAAGPYIEGKYQAYASWGLDRPMAADESLRGSFLDLESGRFILGSPDDCLNVIRSYEEQLGVNYFLLRFQWPGMEHRKVLASLELVGKHLIPAARTR